jgi:hypothetical protein
MAVSGFGLALLLSTLGVGLHLGPFRAEAAVSGAILNYLKGTFVNDETICSNDLAAERAAGGTPRSQVNNSAPYKELYWVTPQGQPSTTVTATAGDTSPINMQLNSMQFICAILTKPNSNTTTPQASTLVTNGQFPNDRAPNPDGSDPVDSMSRYELRTYIRGGSVVSGGGSIAGIDYSPPNPPILTSFSTTSRYWLSGTTPRFTYTPPPGGLKAGTTTITIRFMETSVYTYHNYLGRPGAVTDCTDKNNTSSDIYFGGSIDVSGCTINPMDVTFQIITHNPDVNPVVTAPACNVTGTAVDGDSPGTQLRVDIYDGGALKGTTTTSGASHTFTFAHSVLGTAADWGVHTYRIHAYGVGGTGVPAAPDTDTNVSVGPCGQLSCGTMVPTLGAVGQQTDFQVYMNVLSAGTNPPGNQKFAVTVSGPGVVKTYNPDDDPLSGGTIYSAASQKMSFTPPSAGTYTIAWTYYGKACSTTADAAYAPFFSVQGGDIMAGARFGGSGACPAAADIKATNLGTAGTPNYFGAGSEAGAWATGTLTNFVSGLGLGGGATSQAGSGLSFANTVGTGGTNYGGQYGTCSLPDVADYMSQAIGGAWPGWGSVGGAGTHNYSASGLLTLSGPANLQPGTTVNLYVNGNVYIKSDILYASYPFGYAPRFNLYVAGNIYIDPAVQELHGVYVAQTSGGAGGNIDTCATVSGGVVTTVQSYATCKQKPLQVVGSVAAQGKLQLTRTLGNIVPVAAFGGQPAAAAVPAETFQYSPELWMSAKSNTTLDTQAYTSLPPVL